MYQKYKTASEALEHHGVKGQRWGVRKERDTSGGKVGVDPVTVSIGIAYAAVILAPFAKLAIDAIRFRDDSGKKFAEQTAKVPFKRNPKLKEAKTVEQIQNDVVKHINPDYPKSGTKMNCRRCTFSYEMRRRGYDVQATKSHLATGQDAKGLSIATKSHGGKKPESIWGEKEIGNENGMGKQSPREKADSIFNKLNAEPNGSRGELGIGWYFGGGHSVAYEVVDHKAVVFDTQSGQTFRNAGELHASKITHSIREAAFTRTDNADLDQAFLRRWVKNVESK